MVQRVERHIIINDKKLDDLCCKSGFFYNYCNYLIRKEFIDNGKLLNKYQLMKKMSFEKQVDFLNLGSSISQQVIFQLFRNWASFFALNKEFQKNPKKFKARPNLPKYKKREKRNVVIFTSNICRIKDGYIHFSKKSKLKPLKTKVDNICQVRIVPQATCYIIEVVYKKDIKKQDVKEENILSIDLGLNNLATCINNIGEQPFIINGRPLKSINQFHNKTKAKLQSISKVNSSKRILSCQRKRNNKVQDYLHKTSRIIIDYCTNHKIGTIVIGKNEGWKDSISIGKKNNQSFVSIPHAKLIDMIQYKAEENGIKVILTEESYTSKVDHFAFEEMKHQDKYLGRRVKRGLFQSSAGKLINADVNGAIGIARKVFKDDFVKSLFDRGVAFTPYVVDC